MKIIKVFLLISLFSPITTLKANNFQLGSRQAAMGYTGVTHSDVWANFNNQAGLANIKSTQIGISGENRFLIPDLSNVGVAAAIPTKSGTFGINLSNFGNSSFAQTKIGIGFGKRFGNILSGGIQLNYLSIRLGENYGTANVLSAELGLLAQPTKNLTVGAHIFNPNRAKIADYANENLPTIMRLGINYKFSESVMIDSEIEKDISQKFIFKTGIEYHISKPIYLRVGIATNSFLSTFGFGIEFNKLNLDFSSSYHSLLGYIPQLSITYGF